MSSSEPEKVSDEVPSPSKLVHASGAGPQARGEPAERVLSSVLTQAKEGLRSPDPGAVNEALAGLARSEAAGRIVLTVLHARDTLQEELARERRDHAVTQNELKYARERSAGQVMLAIVGSVLLSWGLIEMGHSWRGVGLTVVGLAMVVVGALPTIRITFPWRRGSGR